MTAASFSIDLDPSRDLIRLRLTGFYSAGDIAHFEAELVRAHQRLDCGPKGGPLTIGDVSDMAIQSQDVVARWGAVLANPSHQSRRLAFVVASTLARMQLQRVIGNRAAQVFTTVAEAEQWLFADAASTAA
ncbi:MAG: hypothetical protein M3R64_01010 [Pseudomonadota bacterium]|nr:hypothetical protein [Pseudomonadota bacterium]